MKRPLAPTLALRYLFAPNRRRLPRALGAVLGVGLSLVPLVVVMQIADGMVRGISARFIETGTYHLQARTLDRLDAPGIARAVERIEQVEPVQLVIPEQQGIGLLSSTAGRAGITIRAVAADIWERDAAFRRYIELSAGSFDLSTPQSIVVGEQVAEQLELAAGDQRAPADYPSHARRADNPASKPFCGQRNILDRLSGTGSALGLHPAGAWPANPAP